MDSRDWLAALSTEWPGNSYVIGLADWEHSTSELGVGSVSLGIHYQSSEVWAETLVGVDW